jgi:pyruvate/oxaloacetate carboxyltransferase
MDPCLVLQIMAAMANSHVDTRANHAKIEEALQYQQKVCKEYQEKASKKEVKKAESK